MPEAKTVTARIGQSEFTHSPGFIAKGRDVVTQLRESRVPIIGTRDCDEAARTNRRRFEA
jgi:hypothetical protein